jgi:hypothetical protein
MDIASMSAHPLTIAKDGTIRVCPDEIIERDGFDDSQLVRPQD